MCIRDRFGSNLYNNCTVECSELSESTLITPTPNEPVSVLSITGYFAPNLSIASNAFSGWCIRTVLGWVSSASARYKLVLYLSDVISIHVIKTDETENLISKEKLDLLKKSAILINTSRGGVVDEDYLIEMLKSKQLFGAGLDVYSEEPPKNIDNFADNVIPVLANAKFNIRFNNKHTSNSIKKKIDKIISEKENDKIQNNETLGKIK